MKELITNWIEYRDQCLKALAIETERSKAKNDYNLKHGIGGFDFPKRTPENTPTFEGFMEWLINK